MNASMSEGATFTRLWAGEMNKDTSILPLAVLHKPNSEVDGEMISVYSLHHSLGGRTNILLEPSTTNISMDEGALIDVKLSSNKIWILKVDGLVLHNLSGPSETGECEQCFGLQESVVAEQLFQSSEHASDDLLWLAHSIYPSTKEQIASRVSSFFLRMLFLPDIFHNSVLRATLQDHNKHFTDSEFHSLTADGLKKEIISLIEHGGASRSPLSLLYCWRNFCSHYFDNWELERVFVAMSLKCCPTRENIKKQGLLLTSSKNEGAHNSVDIVSAAHQSKGNDQWDALEQYIEKYKSFHPRLPAIVAETLLCADRLIELPLWLVQMFKGTIKGTLGMAGSESSPALLFQLYVDYGRYPEATNLLLHYIESLTSLRPADVIRRKRTFAVWFPYTIIERLWCKLGEMIKSGHMVDQCEKLRALLQTALQKHFQQLNIDSDDVMSAATS